MRAIASIFGKQMADLPKNISISIIYIAFPVMAFISGVMGDNLAEAMAGFAIFTACTVPLMNIAMTVAEDMEYKSLRFMVMAGVKPTQYLVGIMGFVCLMTLVPMALYTYFGEFVSQGVFVEMAVVSILSIAASAILGGIIGIFSKNVQQASAMSMPIVMIVMFLPTLSSLNETLERITGLLFPTQAVLIATYEEADLARATIVMGINIVVLLALFVLAYKKKGLKG
jgi:ABC-2 type transport system permease protein